jgi:(p)ppGpp synthase/HD superfamily hydrolase
MQKNNMTPKETIQKLSKQTTDKVFLAKLIAYHFHEGQYRKIEDAPYVVHPERIVAQLETETDKCIAWLHDVVEDTEVKLEDLQELFSAEVIAGIFALTKVEGDEQASMQKILSAPRHVQRIKLLDVLDYWQHCEGMSKKSISKNRHKAEMYYLPLAEKLGEKEIATEIRKLQSLHM